MFDLSFIVMLPLAVFLSVGCGAFVGAFAGLAVGLVDCALHAREIDPDNPRVRRIVTGGAAIGAALGLANLALYPIPPGAWVQ